MKNVEGNNAFTVALINKNYHMAITLMTSKCQWDSEVVIYSDKVR